MKTYRDFLKEAERTAGPYKNNRLALTMGLMGEIAEVVSAEDPMQEIGDVLWHTVQLLALDPECEQVLDRELKEKSYKAGVCYFSDTQILVLAADLIEIMKKTLYQGHNVPRATFWLTINSIHNWLIYRSNNRLVEACEYTVGKLRRRYPDGFSEAASINRVE